MTPLDPKTYEERAMEALRDTFVKRKPLSDWGCSGYAIAAGLGAALGFIIDFIWFMLEKGI